MLKAYYRLPILILMALFAFIVAGCGTATVPREKGNVEFSVNLPSRSIAPGAHYFVEMTNGSTTRKVELVPEGSTATGAISNVYVGEWDVIAYIEDADGNRTHEGSERVLITPGATASCQLKIAPIKGGLTITFTPSSLGIAEPLGSAVLKIGFDGTTADEYYFIGGPDESATLSATDLSPTTYPYVVEIYNATGSCVYTSPQATVDIVPGRTATVNWTPPSGNVSLVTSIDTVPDTPGGLSAFYQTGKVEVSWDPIDTPENDLQGYKLYRKQGEIGAYEHIATVASSKTMFSNTSISSGTYYYRISCYDQQGNESPWSAPVSVVVP